MTQKVLVSAPHFISVIDRFREWLEKNNIEIIVPPVYERLSENELLQLICDVDGVLCGDDQFTARVLDAAPKLKVISKWGTGIDSIDAHTAEKLGIRVCRTSNAFTEPVADTIMGYILCFARNIVSMDKLMKGGIWKKIHGYSLGESTIGVIGVGAIGSAVLRRARPFGAKLLGTDIREVHSGHVDALGVKMVSLHELLLRSDFVSLNCDLNHSSHHLINAAGLNCMKPSAYLINCARGPCVDEKALITALKAGKIAGAALDVFEEEPLPDDSPFRSMDNVLLAPHASNASRSAWEYVHHNTLNQLLDGLRNVKR
ncbi:MAG: phosphoglycerate dehydrogenase [bacterium]|nr:phosphoglycerate dehydrogenase [bacterium]